MVEWSIFSEIGAFYALTQSEKCVIVLDPRITNERTLGNLKAVIE